ncbi:MAG: RNA pseudouridine synthase [Sandaracinaceae bacterium]|nr:RNA pseudouridine synthase [Sandaracinaceae bacterium]
MIALAHLGRHLVVAHKPSGLATTSPDGGDSLTRRLEAQIGGPLHPTSRLDAEVTGLVTFARTKHAIAVLKDARARGAYHREYLGLASATPAPLEGEWGWTIAIDPREPRLRVALEPGARGARAQAACTRYAVRASAAGVAALALFPITGRTHQLRVHAARAGAPLLGDVRYGGPRRLVLDDGRVVRAPRVMLHCRRLTIPDAEGGALELEAPVPDDLASLWSSLGGEPL